MNNVTIIVLGLAVGWFVQVLLTGRQTQRFYNRMKVLRKDGTASIGTTGGIYKGRVYVVLVIDGDDRIVHAEQLSGWTTFSDLRPVPELQGKNLSELMDEQNPLPIKPKVLQAFRNAAREIYKAREEKNSPAETDLESQSALDESAAGSALSD